jgi:hypothetical protein
MCLDAGLRIRNNTAQAVKTENPDSERRKKRVPTREKREESLKWLTQWWHGKDEAKFWLA